MVSSYVKIHPANNRGQRSRSNIRVNYDNNHTQSHSFFHISQHTHTHTHTNPNKYDLCTMLNAPSLIPFHTLFNASVHSFLLSLYNIPDFINFEGKKTLVSFKSKQEPFVIPFCPDSAAGIMQRGCFAVSKIYTYLTQVCWCFAHQHLLI